MIGLDTNILIRYLAQDDPVQSPVATDIIEFRLSEENPGFISIVAMVETVWVLDRAYGLADDEIAAALERILQADTLVVENEQEVFTAMIALKGGGRLVCRCPHRCARGTGWLRPHLDLRQEGIETPRL